MSGGEGAPPRAPTCTHCGRPLSVYWVRRHWRRLEHIPVCNVCRAPFGVPVRELEDGDQFNGEPVSGSRWNDPLIGGGR